MRRLLLLVALGLSACGPRLASPRAPVVLDPADSELRAFRSAFEAESAHPRLIALLSPT